MSNITETQSCSLLCSTKMMAIVMLLSLLIGMAGCKKIDEATLNPNVPPIIRLVYSSDMYRDGAVPGDTLEYVLAAHDQDGSVQSVWFYVNGDLTLIDTVPPWKARFIFPNQSSLHFKMFAMDNQGYQSNSITDEVHRSTYNVLFIEYVPYSVMENTRTTMRANASRIGEIKLIECYVDDQLIETQNLATFDFILDSLSLGWHKIHLIAEKPNGMLLQSRDYFMEVIENMPPVVKLEIDTSLGLAPGTGILLGYHAYDNETSLDSVMVFANDSLIYLDTVPSASKFMYYYPQSGGHYEFRVVAVDDIGLRGFSAVQSCEIVEGRVVEDNLVDFAPGKNPDAVYAISTGNTQRLYAYDPYTGTTITYPLPYGQPVRLISSITDDLMYIAYKNDHIISVFDGSNHSFSEISFDGSGSVIDIEVDAINRRIYVLCGAELLILNQDNGNTLNVSSSGGLTEIAVNPATRSLIGLKQVIYPFQLSRFDVTNDVPVLQQVSGNWGGENSGQLQVNEQQGYIIYRGIKIGNQLRALNISDLNVVEASIIMISNPIMTVLSATDNNLFTVHEDNQNTIIKQYDAIHFGPVSTHQTPHASMVKICTNSNGEKLVVYYEKDMKALYTVHLDEQP